MKKNILINIAKMADHKKILDLFNCAWAFGSDLTLMTQAQ